MFIKQACVPYVVGTQYGNTEFTGYHNGNLCFKPLAQRPTVGLPSLPFSPGDIALYKDKAVTVLSTDGKTAAIKAAYRAEDQQGLPDTCEVAHLTPNKFVSGRYYMDKHTRTLVKCVSSSPHAVIFDVFGKLVTGTVKESSTHHFTVLELGPRKLLVGYLKEVKDNVLSPLGLGLWRETAPDGLEYVRVAGGMHTFPRWQLC